MESDNRLHTQNSLIMIIAEEQYTLRTLFDNKDFIKPSVLVHLNLRSRFNPDLRFYKVNCEPYKRYGYTANELFEEIEQKYIESGHQPLNELYTFIERI